jgi:hypothetical protein
MPRTDRSRVSQTKTLAAGKLDFRYGSDGTRYLDVSVFSQDRANAPPPTASLSPEALIIKKNLLLFQLSQFIDLLLNAVEGNSPRNNGHGLSFKMH